MARALILIKMIEGAKQSSGEKEGGLKGWEPGEKAPEKHPGREGPPKSTTAKGKSHSFLS